MMDQFYHGSNKRLTLLIHIQMIRRMARYGVPIRAEWGVSVVPGTYSPLLTAS